MAAGELVGMVASAAARRMAASISRSEPFRKEPTDRRLLIREGRARLAAAAALAGGGGPPPSLPAPPDGARAPRNGARGGAGGGGAAAGAAWRLFAVPERRYAGSGAAAGCGSIIVPCMLSLPNLGMGAGGASPARAMAANAAAAPPPEEVATAPRPGEGLRLRWPGWRGCGGTPVEVRAIPDELHVGGYSVGPVPPMDARMRMGWLARVNEEVGEERRKRGCWPGMGRGDTIGMPAGTNPRGGPTAGMTECMRRGRLRCCCCESGWRGPAMPCRAKPWFGSAAGAHAPASGCDAALYSGGGACCMSEAPGQGLPCPSWPGGERCAAP